MDNPIWSYFFKPPQQKKEVLELLRSLPVFEGLSNNELLQIERVLHERHYNNGEIVFSEGEPGAGMYIISKGEVAIRKRINEGNDLQLAHIKERSFFGELALLDEIPRSASAHATTETILYGFSKPDLESLVERSHSLGIKILGNLARLICRRLLKTNDNLEKLQSELNIVKRLQEDVV